MEKKKPLPQGLPPKPVRGGSGTGTIAPGTPTIKNLKWWICTLLFLATLINYLHRQTFSVATPEIAAEFQLTNQDIAFINNAFTAAYTVGQLLIGKLMDLLGTLAGFAVIMVVWSAAGMICGLAQGIFSFSLFRFVLGLGESGNWPVSVKAVSEWFTAKQRSLAVAYFSAGSGVGAMLAPILIAQAIIWFGWRWSFIVIGFAGFLWLPLWIWFYRSPHNHWLISKQELAEIEADVGKVSGGSKDPKLLTNTLLEWVRLLTFRQVWGVFLVRVFSDAILWFYIQWLPKYFADERGYSIEDIRNKLWIVFVPAIFAGLLGGAASGRLIRKGWDVDRARKTVMLATGLAMVSSVGVGFVESDIVAIILSSIAVLAFYGYSVNTLTLPADLVPPRLVASVSGLSGTGAGIGSIIFTYIVGVLADRQSFTPAFVLVGLLPLASLTMLFFVMGKIKRIIPA
jgi:ACS family hexuronate transporter-like MFS transporter